MADIHINKKMPDNITNSKRIAKNSLFLYIRMLLIMVVTLYISRVVLAILGAENYGIYSVVGGVVVLFTFLNTAMVSSTQRFLNYEMGKNDGIDSIKDVFSMSVNCHLMIIGLILILGETVGLWFLNSYINIPENRRIAANWIYQFSLLTTCFSVFSAPFNASIIASERMSIYAYISIVEALLRLGVAFALTLFCYDKLIVYGILLAAVALLICILYMTYCLIKLPFCRYKFCWDTSLFRKMISFSGWSLFGGMSNICEVQGINIIVNMFFGVAVNAAMGIANQVASALTTFVSNFATAFNPQIIKTYSAGEYENFYRLLHNTSRFCYLLFFTLCLPVFFYCDTILQIWLKEVPKFTTLFCRLVVLVSLVDSINTPLWTAIKAHGNIKKYNLVTSILRISALPICYVGFLGGLSPEFALLSNLFINIVIQTWVIWHIKNMVGLDISRHIKETILPCLMVSLLSLPLPFILRQFDSGLLVNFLSFILVGILTLIIVLFFGVKKSERIMLAQFIKSKV